MGGWRKEESFSDYTVLYAQYLEPRGGNITFPLFM